MISAFRKGEIMHCVGTHVRTGSLRDTWDSLELLGFNVSIPILIPISYPKRYPVEWPVAAGDCLCFFYLGAGGYVRAHGCGLTGKMNGGGLHSVAWASVITII